MSETDPSDAELEQMSQADLLRLWRKSRPNSRLRDRILSYMSQDTMRAYMQGG